MPWSLVFGERGNRHLPIVQLLWERYERKGIIWLNVCCDGESRDSEWRDFIRDNQLGGIQVRAPELMGAYGVQGELTPFILDEQQKLTYTVEVQDLTLTVVRIWGNGNQ